MQLEQGDLKAVADTLRKNKSTLQSSPEGQLVMAVTQGMACIQDGKLQEASQALDAAGALRAAGTRGDDQLVLDMARVCMANGRLDEADGLVSEVARNAHDSEALLAKAKRIYEEAGRSDTGASVLSSATAGVRTLNNEGGLLAQRGDYQAAVDKLLTACDEAPYNPRIMLDTVWAILKHIDKTGMDETLIGHARRYLAKAGSQAPDNPRLSGLRLQLREVEQRFGIQRAVME